MFFSCRISEGFGLETVASLKAQPPSTGKQNCHRMRSQGIRCRSATQNDSVRRSKPAPTQAAIHRTATFSSNVRSDFRRARWRDFALQISACSLMP